MTYERLIIAVDDVAPGLSDIAYKLLWRLIAIAIHRGTPQVYASQRQLAIDLKRAKESIAKATRELALHITVTPGDGQHTAYSLPADWFPPQRTLFSDETLGGDIHNRPGNQATTGLESRTLPAWNPGHHRPGIQDTRPGIQDTTGLEYGAPGLESRPQWPGIQDTSGVVPIRNAPARNRSIESEASASSKVVDLIDRAWATVEIPADREAEAALLTEAVYAYKCDLGPLREDSAYPDTKIVARLLALAPFEESNCVLRSLRARSRPCGEQDAWFFTVLAQKIHHASPELTRNRMAAIKAKARPYESKPSLFGDELLKRAAAGVRKLG